jgi:hypothetical protein
VVSARGDGALAFGMKSHGVYRLVADTLNDIDLAIGRPVCAKGPERRPDTACIAGHVGQIGNEKALGEFKIGLDPS